MYWAFISYSSADREAAEWLQRALETYRVPGRLIGRPTVAGPAPRFFRPIFRDRSEMAADPDLAGRLQEALEQSAWLIVVCSPNAARSHWVDEEIVRFRALRGEGRILSVLATGGEGGNHHDCFPPSLRYRDEGSASPKEPLAADLRAGGDGRRLVRLKLVAAMLGVGLDELIRRDDQRRHRQMFMVTAAAVAGMTLMGGLAANAVIANGKAQRQRAAAEKLIEFMLGDLRKRLEPSGRLELMDGVAREALSYYAAQNPADLDDSSLRLRAKALTLLGEIGVQLGHLDDASQNFVEAAGTTRELMTRSPNDGQRIFDHAQSVFWVGSVADMRGELAAARAAFQQYLDPADRLIALDPTKDDWWAEVSYAYSNLGTVDNEEGRFDLAADAFQKSLNIVSQLQRHRPDDIDRQLGVGQGHAWLADALERLGRFAEARDHHLSELAIYRAILSKDPTIERGRFSMIPSLRALARLAVFAGDLPHAESLLDDAVSRSDALVAGQKDNMDFDTEAAIAHVELGEVLLAEGRVAGASREQESSQRLSEIALSHDRGENEWRDDLARARLLKAAIDASRRQFRDALAVDSDTLGVMSKEPGVRSRPDAFWLLNRARLQTGDDLEKLHRAREARSDWLAIVIGLSGPANRYEPKQRLVLEAARRRLGLPGSQAPSMPAGDGIHRM